MQEKSKQINGSRLQTRTYVNACIISPLATNLGRMPSHRDLRSPTWSPAAAEVILSTWGIALSLPKDWTQRQHGADTVGTSESTIHSFFLVQYNNSKISADFRVYYATARVCTILLSYTSYIYRCCCPSSLLDINQRASSCLPQYIPTQKPVYKEMKTIPKVRCTEFPLEESTRI